MYSEKIVKRKTLSRAFSPPQSCFGAPCEPCGTCSAWAPSGVAVPVVADRGCEGGLRACRWWPVEDDPFPSAVEADVGVCSGDHARAMVGVPLASATLSAGADPAGLQADDALRVRLPWWAIPLNRRHSPQRLTLPGSCRACIARRRRQKHWRLGAPDPARGRVARRWGPAALVGHSLASAAPSSGVDLA